MSTSVEPSRPWEADRALSLEDAQTAISSQFPDVEVGGLTFLGSGWEFDVYGTTDGWAFRFPRKSRYAELFDREEQILALVRPALEGLVDLPRMELRGHACEFFPYTFVGHRLIPGVSADLSRGSSRDLAADIGRALSRLHAVPEQQGRTAGLEVDPDGCAEWLAEARAVAADLRGLAKIVDVGTDWVEEVTEVPRSYEGPLRVIHNDLKPEHLLVDPSGRLAGIIDWTDTGLGDPALDFVGFLPWRGAPFLNAVLESYDLPLDRDFRDRVKILSRVLSLVWLQECRERGLDCTKNLEWVGRAFATDGSA